MKRYTIFLLLISLLVISCKNKTTNKVTKENTTTQKIKRSTPQKSAQNNITSDTKPVSKTEEGVFYHIVAASYTEKGKATILSKQLYRKGYPSRVLSSKGRYRVTLQAFESKQKALKELERLRKLNKKQDLWLLKQ